MKCNRNEKRIAVLFLSVCIFGGFFFVFAFLYLQKGSPRLEFAKTQLEIYTIKKNALLQLIENVLNKSRSKYVH